jgi:hypothetical protein
VASSICKASDDQWSLCDISLTLLLSPFFIFKAPCDYTRSSWIAQDTLPIFREVVKHPYFHLSTELSRSMSSRELDADILVTGNCSACYRDQSFTFFSFCVIKNDVLLFETALS